MQYYAEYSASTYCNSDNAAGALVTCEDGCPQVMANGATVVGSLPNTTIFEMEGYVAVDSVRKEVVVAFRGSSGLRNWIADLTFLQVPCNYTTGCAVHSGFKIAWESISEYTLDLVKTAFAAYPGYTLVVTGHSLGGANLGSYACDLYTYGSPRVGNLALVKFVTNQAGAEYRATHFDDPVPRLPPILFGYFHTSPEYWLASGPATNIDYTIDEIETCLGYANTSCNAGTFGLDGDAHVHYFQYMGCDSVTISTDMSLSTRDGITGNPLWARDDVSDEELEIRLNNYTTQDLAYSRQLAADGSAN
ncbi:putative lipase [Diaporthe ampelina]|uniref:Putative lipase n=1 Tax=Diaporthe ampelina TaxID=1214573 RepID=A0A0G2FPP4_9PEZI|nr:putative lipase [Diaporthe ampelina]